MKNIHPLNKIKLVGTIVGVLVLGIVVGIKDPGQARANTNDNVHGYLFSDMPTTSDQRITTSSVYGGQGLGYISLNNVAPDPVLPGTYGVNFDPFTGKFQGYGWSEYGDYVDFAPTAATPSGPGTTSGPIQINTNCLATPGPCSVLGWIKFTQSGMTSLGGWDGWVSMHGTTSSGSSYGVMYNPTDGTFSGAGWGSDVVGWVDFSKATVDLVPSLSCADPVLGTIYTYTDPANPPTECGAPGMSVCYSDPGHVGHLYITGTTPPSVCTVPPNTCADSTAYNYGLSLPCDYDFCPVLIPGIQKLAQMQNGYEYPSGSGTWYGLSSGVCTQSVCSNHSGFYATAVSPEVQLPDGTCGIPSDSTYCKLNPTAVICNPSSGPLKPIYKEN